MKMVMMMVMVIVVSLKKKRIGSRSLEGAVRMRFQENERNKMTIQSQQHAVLSKPLIEQQSRSLKQTHWLWAGVTNIYTPNAEI